MAEALSIVGATIGFMIGGAPGMYIGSMIGQAVGSHIEGPTKMPAPALNEAPVQTSREGIAIPIVWGTHHMHGNIIAKVPEVQWSTYQTVGDSLFSSGTRVETKHRSRTFAIGLCRSAYGPIAGVSRIWEDEKLVYDSRETPDIPAAETTAYAAGITIYLGDESQLPDPDLEAHFGVGSTPAFRGLGYIVWADKELTETGGRIPNYRFEVNAYEDASESSKPYPIEAIEGIAQTATPDDGAFFNLIYEGVAATVTPDSGTLDVRLVSGSDQPMGLETTVLPVTSGIAGTITDIDDQPIGMAVTTTPQDGTLEVRLVSYDDLPVGLETTVTPQDGTLT